MKQKFLLVSILFLTLSLNAADKEKTAYEIWNETSISVENVTYFVNQKNCYSKKEILWGCFEALNVLANGAIQETLKPTSVLKFVSKAYSQSNADKVIKKHSEFNDLVLVTIEVITPEEIKQKITPREIFLKAKAENVNYHNSLSSFMNLPKLNFEKLIADLMNKQTKQERSKYIMGAAINKYLEFAYDPHTVFIPSESGKKMLEEPKPMYGIGVEVNENEKGVLVINTYEDSPAEKAGMLPGDIITHVENAPVGGLPLADSVDKIRGELNTNVKLKVLRENTTLDINVIRGKVSPDNVTSKIVNNFSRKYSYVRLRSFINNSCSRVANAFLTQYYQPGSVKGLILDFRGNPGGSLEEAKCLGAFLTNNKPVVYVKNLVTNKEEPEDNIHHRVNPTLPKDAKLVILIDGQSASASELVAAGVQDYQNAWIVGERSFGKGTVQVVPDSRSRGFDKFKDEFNLPSGMTVKKTIARFYSPRRISNQIVGVLPDITVPLKPGLSEADRFYFREENIFETSIAGANPPRPPLKSNDVMEISTKCLSKNRAEEIYKVKTAAKLRVDYQILKAEEILECDHDVFGSRMNLRTLGKLFEGLLGRAN